MRLNKLGIGIVALMLSLAATAYPQQGGGGGGGGGGTTIPGPTGTGQCFVSTASGTGNWTWGSCSGTTSLGFNTVTTGTNTTAVMTVGSGGTLNSASGAVIDFSATTFSLFKLPVLGGGVTTANGNIGYDSTTKNWHVWANAVDNYLILSPASGTFTNNDCAKFSVATGVVTLLDTGATCGGGISLGTAAQIPVMNSGATAYAPVTMSQDCTMTAAGVITCTKTNNTAFGTFATQNYATPPAIGGTTPAAGTFNALTDTAMSGGPFCVHETSGVLSATSADCGSGGSTSPGGSNTQLQWNNSSAFGGISGWTTNGTTNLTAATTSVLDLHSMSSTSGLLLPGALATGIVGVTTSTGAVNIYNASAQIPANFVPFASPGAIGGTTAAAGTFTSLTDTGMSGGPLCVHEISGVLSAAGADCGSGGGNTTSTSLTTNKVPKANGANSIIDSSITDNGSTLATSDTSFIIGSPGAITAGTGALLIAQEGTEPSSVASGYSGFVMDSTQHCPVIWNNGVQGGCAGSTAYPGYGVAVSNGLSWLTSLTVFGTDLGMVTATNPSGAAVNTPFVVDGNGGMSPAASGALGTNAFSNTAFLPLSGGTLTGALSGTTVTMSGAITDTSDGTHAGSMQLAGNTALPTGANAPATTGIFSIFGFNSTSSTSYGWQPNATAPSGTQFVTAGTPSGSPAVSAVNYVSSVGSGSVVLASSASTTVNGQSCSLGSSCTISLSAVNPQTATYQVLASDFSSYKTITVASGTFTITLIASGSQPANGQYINVINYGSGVVTIARSGQNINGATTSITLNAGSAAAPTSAYIESDGSNYFATVDEGTVGTVTSVAQTVPTGFAIGGSPITNSGTLAITTTGLSTNVLQKAVSGGIGNSTITDNGTTVSTTEPLVSTTYNTCPDSSGSGTAQVCNTTPTFSVVTGSCITYTTTTANTGTGLTLNVNSLGAKSVAKWQGSTTLAANDVLANKQVKACYDGTNWELATIGNAPTGGSSAWSSLTAPTGALSITMPAGDTTAMTWATQAAPASSDWLWTAGADSGTSTVPAFSFVDTTGNTKTGALLNVNTVGSSTALPVQFTAQGTANGVSMSTAGLLAPIGSGGIKASAFTTQTQNTVFGAFGSTTPSFTAVASCSGSNNGIIYTTNTGFGCGSNFVQLGATNLGTSTMTLNMAASTTASAFKVPVQAGATTTVAGAISADSTNLEYHGDVNSQDAVFVSAPSGSGTGLIDSTGLTAAVTAANLYLPASTQRIRVCGYLKVTTAATTSSILGGTTGIVLTYTDGTDSVAQTVTMPMASQAGNTITIGTGNTGNATTTVSSGCTGLLYAKSAGQVQYAIGYTSLGATPMAYEAHLTTEVVH